MNVNSTNKHGMYNHTMTVCVSFNRDDIGILERISGTAVTSIVHERIKQHIESTCKGNFETSYLDTLQNVSICTFVPILCVINELNRSDGGRRENN